ncbi:HET domain-containing protein [Trichoderma evansii]
MGEYNYQPLDLDRPAIRLLTLHGGSDDDEIFCSLFQAELRERDETIPYDALSYTWGSPDLTERIIVDGCYLNVTSHLFVALRHLRYQDKDRILWIDAICINQGSKKERGHQVEQMSKIYKEADRHNIIDYSLQDPLWKYMWSSVELSLKRSYTNFSDLQRRGLQEIFKRPWFRRVWILQEVALARVGFIQCGTRSVSTRFFGLLPVLLNIKPDAHCQSVLDIMPSPWRKTSWWSKSPNLRTLLLNFGDSEATESRDLVYALRGISSDAAKKNVIIPDYDNSEEDLVREVVQFVEHCELEDLALPTTPCTIRDLVKCLRALNLNRCMALAEQSLPHDMEMLLERPEVRINEDVVGAAAECDKTGEDFTVSDDVLIAAAKNQSGAKGVFEALLRYQGGRIAISDTVLMAAAENKQCSDEVLEDVFIAAANNKRCGDKVINTLLSHYPDQVNFSKEAAIAAAKKKGCRDRIRPTYHSKTVLQDI